MAAFAKSWRRKARAALGVAAGALSEQGTALRLLMAPASTLVVDELLVVQLAIRPFDPQRCLMRDLG
jgi:hypothetical protein